MSHYFALVIIPQTEDIQGAIEAALKIEWRQIGAWTGYNPVHAVGGVFPTDRDELVAYLRSLGPTDFENLILAVRHS